MSDPLRATSVRIMRLPMRSIAKAFLIPFSAVSAGCIPIHAHFEYYQPRACTKEIGEFPNLACSIDASGLSIDVRPPLGMNDTVWINVYPPAGRPVRFRYPSIGVAQCGSAHVKVPIAPIALGDRTVPADSEIVRYPVVHNTDHRDTHPPRFYAMAKVDSRPPCLELQLPDMLVEGKAHPLPPLRFDWTKTDRWVVPHKVGY